MQPQVPYELLWDPAVERDGGRAKRVREQLLAATREPLVPTRQRDLLTALTEDPGLVQRFCIAPAQLPSLVEHNPNVAVQVNKRTPCCNMRIRHTTTDIPQALSSTRESHSALMHHWS